MMTKNALYYGDNLSVLREHGDDESVDLIYLDPPFNSKATYNILFGGNGKSQAQIHAFDDTWHWGEEAESSYAAGSAARITSVDSMIDLFAPAIEHMYFKQHNEIRLADKVTNMMCIFSIKKR